MEKLSLPAAKILLNEILPLESLIARRTIEHTTMPKNKVHISVIELKAIYDGEKMSYEVFKATGGHGSFGKATIKYATLSKALLEYNALY